MGKCISMACLLICALVLMSIAQVHGDTDVPVTILESAVAKGAVCLDGSAPAYAYAEGYGSGSDNWIVYFLGGAWCEDIPACVARSKQNLGSSRFLDSQITFAGMLDSDCTINPIFCNWNRVYLHYCDGASFMADVEKVDPETNLTFRGSRIFDVMMDEMLFKGMRNARNAILTGTSAGGLSTILHCDKFRRLFPSYINVKCVADSGFFIRGKGIFGQEGREALFAGVVKTHELANSLPQTCTSKRNSSLCFFPEYLVEDIKTPLFIIESSFDRFQIGALTIGYMESCTNNLKSCNSTQLGIIRDFGKTFKRTLEHRIHHSWKKGMFVHSCYLHEHLLHSDEWTCLAVEGKTLRDVVGDWYYFGGEFRLIDREYELPLNCTDFCHPPIDYLSLPGYSSE